MLAKNSKAVQIAIPIDTARLLCERAEERWHTHSGVVQGDRRKTVQVFAQRQTRMGMGGYPIGNFTMLWGAPLPSQATISQIEWNLDQGGSEEAIRYAINSLVGWPIANPSTLLARAELPKVS
jgi:hypothetical protein